MRIPAPINVQSANAAVARYWFSWSGLFIQRVSSQVVSQGPPRAPPAAERAAGQRQPPNLTDPVRPVDPPAAAGFACLGAQTSCQCLGLRDLCALVCGR